MGGGQSAPSDVSVFLNASVPGEREIDPIVGDGNLLLYLIPQRQDK